MLVRWLSVVVGRIDLCFPAFWMTVGTMLWCHKNYFINCAKCKFHCLYHAQRSNTHRTFLFALVVFNFKEWSIYLIKIYMFTVYIIIFYFYLIFFCINVLGYFSLIVNSDFIVNYSNCFSQKTYSKNFGYYIRLFLFTIFVFVYCSIVLFSV